MKKLIFILLAFGTIYGQAIYFPKQLTPFATGNDTILAGANLHSSEMFIGGWLGAITLGIEADSMAVAATTPDDIEIYFRGRLVGMPTWGVPYDSIAVDSILIGTYLSADVDAEAPFYIDLANEPWWTYFDYMKITLDPGASADTVLIRSILRGQ